jgi:hypothetical protein
MVFEHNNPKKQLKIAITIKQNEEYTHPNVSAGNNMTLKK